MKAPWNAAEAQEAELAALQVGHDLEKRCAAVQQPPIPREDARALSGSGPAVLGRNAASDCAILNCPELDSPAFSPRSNDAQELEVPAPGKTNSRGRTKTKPGRKRTDNMVSSKAFDTEAFLTTVGAGRTVATYKPKNYIFCQGTKCDAVFYIQKGHVELSVVSDQGKERVVGILVPGSFLGEGCLPGHPRYLASAR